MKSNTIRNSIYERILKQSETDIFCVCMCEFMKSSNIKKATHSTTIKRKKNHCPVNGEKKCPE